MKDNAVAGLLAGTLVCLACLNGATAAPALRSLVMEAQSPSTAVPGGLVYFPFSITRTGAGSMSTLFAVSGLPPGATFSFYPPEISFDDQSPSTKNAILVIRLDPLTPAQNYTITVTAQKGNSPEFISATVTLAVSGSSFDLMPPVLDIPTLRPDGALTISGIGTALQPVLVQATTDLSLPNSWQTIAVQTLDERGLFSLVDLDWTNYPARFYRAAQ